MLKKNSKGNFTPGMTFRALVASILCMMLAAVYTNYSGVILKETQLVKDGVAVGRFGSFRFGKYLGVEEPTGTLPILNNVMINAVGGELTMTTTDLDISITSAVACEVAEAGASTLPVKLLANLVSKAGEGEIEVEIDAREQATIVAGTAKYKLVGLSEKEFPRLPKDDEAASYTP